MKLTEKMSYLQGLIDGLDVDNSTKEGKALLQMADVMNEMVMYVEDLQSQVDELTELCDILDEDLGSVEEDFYDYDDCDCDDDCDCCCEDDDEDDYELDEDEELYEVTCPTCGDTILLDESIIEEGSMNCPNCNELLEFDDERSGGFEPLKYVPEDKKVVLGLITSKRPQLEDKEFIKQRIKEASKYIPLERLCLSPQCGFASCEIGNKLTDEDQWKKLALVKEIATEVFGEA